MPVTKETYAIQSGLADYCRKGVLPQLPGLSPNRVQQYRRLVYNIIDDTFQGAFPVTRSLLNDDEWHALVNDFFSHHHCQTPSIWRLPLELYEYVAAHDFQLKETYPFLTDLLYFEWLEIDVHTMPDEIPEKFKPEGDWLTDRIVLNKEYKLLQFRYPVHLYKPVELIKEARYGNYFVLIFRQRESGNVQFFDVSPLYCFIISQLCDSENSLSFIISQTCSLFGLQRSNDIERQVIGFLSQLQSKGFVLGFAGINESFK